MAQDRTSGFDMLIQISETELNNQVAAAFAVGLLFPSSMSTPFTGLGLTGQLDLNFNTPVVDLDRPRPQIGLTVPFVNSQFEVTAPVAATIAPLAGTIVIVDAVQIRATGGTQQAVLDFTAGTPTVTVVFDAATAALLTPILAPLGVTVAAAQNQMAAAVRDQLVNNIGRLPVTPPIPVANDTDPLTPFSFDVTTVNDTTAADRDALTFGVRTDAASGGNINGVTQSFIPGGGQSVVMMSNFWLLARVLRPQLATQLGRPITDFDTPLRLNRSIPAPGGEGTLTNLEARVEGNRIRVDGRATASGTGWSAVSTFTFFVDLSLSGGSITVTASSPVVDTDVDLEWWVWLVSLGLGALFGGIIGAIIGLLVPVIVEAIAEGIADGLISDAFSDAVGTIPPIPLGPIGGGLTVSNLILDDLEFRGPIKRSLKLPIKSQGSHLSAGAFTLDLDSGAIHAGAGPRPHVDLAWEPAGGLDTQNGAGMTVTGVSYGALTPVQLRNFGFWSTHLSTGSIPLSFVLPFLGVANVIVVGVRTNEGRLAKIRAYRDLLAGGALRIDWTTYDTPVPALDIAIGSSVTGKGASFAFIGKDFAPCTRYEVSRHIVVEAWPRLVKFPVNYQWCLCGTVLQPGKGQINHGGGVVTYALDGRHLTLDTEIGRAIDCELCVSAIDAKNRELFTCVRLKEPSTDTKCGKGRKFYPKPKFEIIPCDPLIAVSNWEAVSSLAVQKQIVAALGERAVQGGVR